MLCDVIQELYDDVPENGTVEIVAFFRDEDGNPVIPADLYYSLVDVDGNIINNLDKQPLPLEDEVHFFLKGNDLALSPIERSTGWAYRWVVLGGEYNSGSTSGLPISAMAKFKVCAVKYK